MKEKNFFLVLIGLFLFFYFMPIQSSWFNSSISNGLILLHEYAVLHILTCLVPAFFIAGAISVFVKKQAVLKYLGGNAKKIISYPVASISGTILAVCSCTVLPLFASIHKRGAGLGPGIAFLFSGPAINIAAIFLTASVLGFEIGLARAVSAVLLAGILGLTMAFLFKEKSEKKEIKMFKETEINVSNKILLLFFISMILILVVNGLSIDKLLKFFLTGFFVLIVVLIALFKFEKQIRNKWFLETWRLSKLLIPFLFIGVFIVGFVTPLIPEKMIIDLVGENSFQANIIAALFGAFMYFSTLTEVPIMQALIEKGMHSGPALSLLLAGPSLSLPAMLVIKSVLGNKKTITYIFLVIVYSSIAGFIFGAL